MHISSINYSQSVQRAYGLIVTCRNFTLLAKIFYINGDIDKLFYEWSKFLPNIVFGQGMIFYSPVIEHEQPNLMPLVSLRTNLLIFLVYQ